MRRDPQSVLKARSSPSRTGAEENDRAAFLAGGPVMRGACPDFPSPLVARP